MKPQGGYTGVISYKVTKLRSNYNAGEENLSNCLTGLIYN